MKRSVTLFLVFILLVSCLVSCDFFEPKYIDETTETTQNTETTKNAETTEHVHQWKDASGEHARICTECNEKQLKPEACNFVRESCELPAVCSVCHAVGDEAPEEHNWVFVRQDRGCWHINISYVCSKCNIEQFADGELVLPNHSWAEKTTDGKTTFSCTRCNESITFVSEIETFSYADVLAEYKIGAPGVKHENVNHPDVESEITSVIDAITRAKFELTIEYDILSVFYDEESNMWCVNFYTLNIPGGNQSVYLNGNGFTCYIVYGE